MGFSAEVAEIDRMSARGVDRQHIVEDSPERMLSALG
jgi:hypothetical protein